jgi:hypothetical protein
VIPVQKGPKVIQVNDILESEGNSSIIKKLWEAIRVRLLKRYDLHRERDALGQRPK